MSGGSFDYLCYLSFDGTHQRLLSMADAIDEAVGDSAAARETRKLANDLEIPQDLRDVWRAVEWWKSNDYGIEQAQAAIDEFEADSENGMPTTKKWFG
jgi:hypothetical protein